MDWVGSLEKEYPVAGYGTNVRVQLRHLVTGEYRTDVISQECWSDEDFRHGYETRRARKGYELDCAS